MGMNFTTLTVAIIVMSMFALGVAAFMADIATTYDVTINESYSRTYQKIDEISNLTNQVNNQIVGDSSTSATSSEALAQQGQSAVILAMQGTALVGAVAQDAAEEIPLPSWYVGGILGIIITILGLLAIAIITKQFIRP